MPYGHVLCGAWQSPAPGFAFVTGPAPFEHADLRRWLERGCTGRVPVRQGFIATLAGADGSLVVATSSRWEQSCLFAVREDVLYLGYHPRDLIGALPSPPPLRVDKLLDGVVLYDDPATTVYAGVERLPNGHVLERSIDGIIRTRRWFTPSTEEDRSITLRAAPGLMRAAVREAVEASIPASGDIAATLSGGLDSSMIVATASRLLAGQRRTVHAFTHVPLPGTQSPGPGWDVEDGPYAEAVIGSLSGVRWEQVSNDDRVPPLVDDLRSIEQAWQPSVNPTNVTWVAEMLRRAESVGSPLLLTGAAGNATFSRSSEGVVRGLLRHGRVDALVRQIRSRHRVGLDWSRAARSVLVETLPDAVLRWRRARAWRRAGDPLGTAVYGSFPARFDALSEPARARLEDLVAGVGTPRRADWISFATADYARIGLGPNMSDTVWWSDPLSDPELVSLALRLPEEAWLAGGRDRGLAREAVAGLVPDRVRLRRTSGAQSADCGLWMVGQEPAYRALLERFRASPSVGEFLDLEALERSIGPEMTDPATASDWQDVYGRAFSLGHFAVWYEDEVLGRA